MYARKGTYISFFGTGIFHTLYIFITYIYIYIQISKYMYKIQSFGGVSG